MAPKRKNACHALDRRMFTTHSVRFHRLILSTISPPHAVMQFHFIPAGIAHLANQQNSIIILTAVSAVT